MVHNGSSKWLGAVVFSHLCSLCSLTGGGAIGIR